MTGKHVSSPLKVAKIDNRKLLECAQILVASSANSAYYYAEIHTKWTLSTCAAFKVLAKAPVA